jgi:hypothetical protein
MDDGSGRVMAEGPGTNCCCREQKEHKPIFLPKSVAMAVGVGVEAFAKLQGKPPLFPDKSSSFTGDWVTRGEAVLTGQLISPKALSQPWTGTASAMAAGRFGTRKIVT